LGRRDPETGNTRESLVVNPAELQREISALVICWIVAW